MITEKQISEHASTFFEGSDIFVVNIQIKPGNKITVYLDGDNGVTVSNCAKFNRYLENQLDRSNEDFDLTVSSVGADQPLVMGRQYVRHVGRILNIITNNGDEFTGKLEKFENNSINLLIPEDKKKKNLEEEITIALKDIKQAKIEIIFKK